MNRGDLIIHNRGEAQMTRNNSFRPRTRVADDKKRRELIERMKEGYRKMGPLNLELAEEGFHLARENEK